MTANAPDHDHHAHAHPAARVTRGRRVEDFKRNIEIHPVALSAVAGFLTVILGIAGYFFKGWADNITFEIRQFRLAAEKQLTENATHNEWKNDMSRWRDGVDIQLKDLDNRMDTLPWSVARKGRRPVGPIPQPQKLDLTDGGTK